MGGVDGFSSPNPLSGGGGARGEDGEPDPPPSLGGSPSQPGSGPVGLCSRRGNSRGMGGGGGKEGGTTVPSIPPLLLLLFWQVRPPRAPPEEGARSPAAQEGGGPAPRLRLSAPRKGKLRVLEGGGTPRK